MFAFFNLIWLTAFGGRPEPELSTFDRRSHNGERNGNRKRFAVF